MSHMDDLKEAVGYLAKERFGEDEAARTLCSMCLAKRTRGSTVNFFSSNMLSGGGYVCAGRGEALARGRAASIEEAAQAIRAELDSCDAVIIGAGAGLSTAAGLIYSGKRFDDNFADFRDRFGITDMYSGGFFPFPDRETYWAWWSRHILVNRYVEAPNDTYKRLLDLVANKDYFVITTNVDHQFQKAGFDKKRLFYTQGDYGLFQCSRACTQETYDNKDAVHAMVERQRDMRVPSELVPKCPNCGALMMTNLRVDNRFVEDAGWHAAAERYSEFCRRHEGMRVLYLELGVGGNTPVIIKYPFWNAVDKNEYATYACVNMGEACAPKVIEDRSILVDEDINITLMQR